MVDAGRVDDARRVVEAVAIERGCSEVQRLMVEGLGQLLLVAADDRHVVDRGDRRNAERAQRGDQAATRRFGERQIVDGGREDVGDLLRDQLLGRGHADVERLVERADRLGRLLAESGVRLVGDHEVVRVARDLVDVASEPGVRLDRDRVLARRCLPTQSRVGEPPAVPLGGEVAVELLHEQPTVREDQDAEVRAASTNPAAAIVLPDAVGWRNSASRRSRVGAAVDVVLGVRDRLEQAELVLRLLLERLGRLVERHDGAVAVAVLLLVRVDELGQYPGERVDLV